MKKIIAFPFTFLYLIVYILILVFFHPIQWFAFRFFGYSGHKKAVDSMNITLIRSSLILGNTVSYTQENYPTDRPIIFVSNHQSMYDISPLQWHFRKHHPKFVSKLELGKGIPSISFNLRHGGSVLIDRKDKRQAISQIANMGKYIEKHKRSVVIFPEGTRSKTGVPGYFKPTGLKMLIKNSPSALIVPITINNSWKILKYGKFPYGMGVHIKIKGHAAMESTGDFDTLFKQIENIVTKDIII